MKIKLWLALSLIANAALLGAFLWTSLQNSPKANAPKWVPPVPSPIPGHAENPVNSPATQTRQPANRPPFRWVQIETDNYGEYIANLRSVGCPELTIRDIVEADVNQQLFEARYSETLNQMQSFDYWRRGMDGAAAQTAIRDAIAALDSERIGFLRQLLGEDYFPRRTLVGCSPSELAARTPLGFLRSEQQETVLTLNEQFEAKALRIRSEISDPAEQRQALAANEQSRRDALATFLTAEELRELDLRHSPAADSLRRKLKNFEVSESEFRKLFELHQSETELQATTLDLHNPETLLALGQEQENLNTAYQELLGQERYVDWKRQDDRDWQSLKDIADTHRLGRDKIEEAYQLRQEANQEIVRTMLNQELNEEERLTLAATAQAQYNLEMETLIGEKATSDLGALPEPLSAQFIQPGQAFHMKLPAGMILQNSLDSILPGVINTEAEVSFEIRGPQIRTEPNPPANEP